MRSLFILIAATGLAAEPPLKLGPPVLGHVFDPGSKSIRAITGVPGSASIEAPATFAAKLEIGFVSQNRRYLVAATLEGVVVADMTSDMVTSATRPMPEAPTDIALGCWSDDSDSIAVWSRSGKLQIWNSFQETPALLWEVGVDEPRGLAVANGGKSVLIWSDSGLRLVDASGSRQLVNEPVFGAAIHSKSGDWAAATESQLLRSNAEPAALSVAKPKAVAFASNAVLVAGRNAVEVFGESGQHTVPCDCEAAGLHPLSGGDVYRLTGMDTPAVTIFDGSTAEPRIFYIPTPGGRQ